MAFKNNKKNTDCRCIKSLGGETGWCEVKDEEVEEDIKDYQLWKLHGNSIVSKFNHGIIGTYGNTILSAYTGDGDMVGAVSVDKTTSSNYSFKLTGIYDQNIF